MALESALRADSPWGRLRALWSAFSRTIAGDIVSTVIAIGGVAVLFLAGSFAVIYLVHAYDFAAHLMGAK